MDKLQLLDQQNQLQDKIKELIKNGENEVRKLTDNENSSLTNLKNELQSVKDKLEEIRKSEENTSKTNKLTILNKRSMKRFSLVEAIRNEAERRNHSDETIEVLEEGKRNFSRNSLEYKGALQIPMEYRADIVAASNTAVATDKFSIIEPLRGNLVTVAAGAQLMTGLVGNVSMPSYSGSTAKWQDETGDSEDGAGTFSEVTMAPKRLTFYLDISKQFLNQDSVNAEQLLMNDLTKALSAKLEATIFGKHTSATNTPDGFFTGTPTYKVTGAADWAKVVSMETGVDAANAANGSLAYILHPSLRGKMKTTAKATNQAIFLLDPDGKANGYNVFSTTHMASGLQTGTDEYGILFGNWNDLIIGQWGALDITVDPYTQAAKGKIRIVVNSYWDVVKRRAASFAVGSLK